MVPPVGDADGSGTVLIQLTQGWKQLCFTLTVSGLDQVTALHLHTGREGTTGPVLATLLVPGDGTASGCVAVDDRGAKKISKAPGNYYVDVHTAEFPDGALRGQLTG